MKTFLDKLLAYFELDHATYDQMRQPVTFTSLPDFSHFTGIEIAVERIEKAIANQEKIVIYGDYDCDGISATTILVYAFKLLNYPVGYYIPSRYIDGYGLNGERVKQFYEKGYQLIITVDNGVSQHQAIDLANSYDIDVIVTDHHQILDHLPAAYAILHPTYSNYGTVVTCGAYVALMLATALLKREERYLVTLAALATMSDMMVLKEYNRAIVKLGSEYLNENQYRALTLLAGEGPYTEDCFSLGIAPKINAIGRMVMTTDINLLVEYLSTNDEAKRQKLYQWIISINQERRATMKDALNNNDEVDLTAPAIVVVTKEKEGLIGLLAAQYLNSYDKPAIVFTASELDADLLKGSARSRAGFNIAKAFQSLADILISYGGHGGAGGCSINKSDLLAFKQRFNALAEQYLLETEHQKTIAITLSEVNWENYQLMREFAPFGHSFPAPYFKLADLHLKNLTFSRDNKHLLTTIDQNIKLVGFNKPASQFNLQATYNFYGRYTLSTYRNATSLQFQVDEIEEV